MTTKWKYRLAIIVSIIVTSAVCWFMWISLPQEIVVIAVVVFVVVGGFILDAYVSRRVPKSDSPEDFD